MANHSRSSCTFSRAPPRYLPVVRRLAALVIARDALGRYASNRLAPTEFSSGAATHPSVGLSPIMHCCKPDPALVYSQIRLIGPRARTRSNAGGGIWL